MLDPVTARLTHPLCSCLCLLAYCRVCVRDVIGHTLGPRADLACPMVLGKGPRLPLQLAQCDQRLGATAAAERGAVRVSAVSAVK
jgi:hypothetical protein